MRFLIRDVIGPKVQISTIIVAGSAADLTLIGKRLNSIYLRQDSPMVMKTNARGAMGKQKSTNTLKALPYLDIGVARASIAHARTIEGQHTKLGQVSHSS